MRSGFLSDDQVSRTFTQGGVHSVNRMSFTPRRHQAECDCGWTGPRRLLRGAAVVDTYRHAAVHLTPSDFSTLPYAATQPVPSAR